MLALRQPSFRTATDVVRLDALVEEHGQPVGGLTAADFIVRDNDVVQRVTLLPESGPLSVAVVLDVSGSITSEQVADVALATDALREGLGPGDRLSAYAFAAGSREVALPHGVASAAALQELASEHRRTAGQRTALFDALQMAMLADASHDESRLLIALTDGRDNTSWVDARTVMDTAMRRGICLFFVALPASVPSGPADVPQILTDPGLRLLRLLAGRTGGRVIDADRARPLGPVFEGIMREYRRRYILSFEPTGVPRGDGRHRVTVAVKGRRGTVHVRDGYWSR
ncbi:MAG: VWA domain-containing protein [Vicinamibacteraceae bacterium]